MKAWTSLAAIVLLSVVPQLHANPIVPPSPPEKPLTVGARNAEIIVEVEENLKEARLQIPIGLLTRGAEKPRQGADAGRVPTLIAGLALTCAFVSGGFWLVRRGRGRTLAAGLLGLSLLVGVSAVFANKAPPPPPKVTPVTLPANIKISGKIVLEVVPRGDKIRLVVPKDMVVKNEDK